MHALIEKLLPGPVVTDGAWGTQLQGMGLMGGECPDAWNMVHPDLVKNVAASYVAAGSRIILTNTFGANRIRLAAHGLAQQAADINRAGARLSRQAAGESPKRTLVFASIGPTGRMPSVDKTGAAELKEVFGEQAMALKVGGADALLLETFADLAEVLPAVAAAKATGLPVVASMVFDSGKGKDRTMTGVTPEQAAAALEEAGADAVGANCGCGIDGYIPVCRRMRSATKLPLWLKPNAGMPEVVEGKTVYRITPDEFALKTLELVKEGADFVGGCCGTSPAFIAAIVKAIGAGGRP